MVLLYLVFISFSAFFFPLGNSAESTEPSAVLNPSNNSKDILPAKTRMVIPLAIMREYQSVAEEWGHPFNYLSHYYSSLGPSTLNKGGDTYYIPLSREDGKSITQAGGKTEMVDLMNVQTNDGDLVFTTIKTVNISNQPVRLSSARFGKKNPFLIPADIHTEAGASCIGCSYNIAFNTGTAEEVRKLRDIAAIIQPPVDFNKQMINNFCETCGKVEINNFLQYVDKRAKKEKIPPEIFFAIMFKESKGECLACKINCSPDKTGELIERSFGLFQINTKDSTKLNQCGDNIKDNNNNTTSVAICDKEGEKDLCNKEENIAKMPDISDKEMQKVCENGNFYKKTSDTGYCERELDPKKVRQGVCLNNPYCNFEEALHNLNCKWLTVHRKRCADSKPTEMEEVCKVQYKQNIPQMPNIPWSGMSTIEKDLWRFTVMAYNSATNLIYKAKKEMDQMSSEEMESELGIMPSLSVWEKTRIYIHRKLCGDLDPTGQCDKLAYVGKIIGTNPNEEETSLLNQWDQYKKKNSLIKCSQLDK